MDLIYGTRLQQARETAKISRERAAEMLGVSVSSLAAYERGITEPPANVVLRMMHGYRAQWLGMEYLMRDAVFSEVVGKIPHMRRSSATLAWQAEHAEDTALMAITRRWALGLEYDRAVDVRKEIRETVAAGLALLAAEEEAPL